MRSRRVLARVETCVDGITSACAEQTWNPPCRAWPGGDHLRVCGADLCLVSLKTLVAGSPPRVRSRRVTSYDRPGVCGITSACAEQTVMTALPQLKSGDHLRVCGADRTAGIHRTWLWGSPPRVRKQTSRRAAEARCTGDHLRVCGADPQAGPRTIPIQGSPPRVRSRRACRCARRAHGRITSACAEQTGSFGSRPMSIRDHLRVCGADPTRTRARSPPSGSPPRVRSRRGERLSCRFVRGITSACAEQTTATEPT